MLVVESHNLNDIIQMAGRLRKGVKSLFVIIDSTLYIDDEYEKEADFCKTQIANIKKDVKNNIEYSGASNEFFKQLCSQNNIEDYFGNICAIKPINKLKESSKLTDYIEYIQCTFNYVQYSYIRNAFIFYELRKLGKLEANENKIKFDIAKNKGRYSYEKIGREMFSNAKIVASLLKAKYVAINHLEQALKKNNSNIFTKEQVKIITSELNEILGESYRNTKNLLESFSDYTCEDEKHKKNTNKRIYKKNDNLVFE